MITNLLASVVITLSTNVTSEHPTEWLGPDTTRRIETTTINEVTTFHFEFGGKQFSLESVKVVEQKLRYFVTKQIPQEQEVDVRTFNQSPGFNTEIRTQIGDIQIDAPPIYIMTNNMVTLTDILFE